MTEILKLFISGKGWRWLDWSVFILVANNLLCLLPGESWLQPFFSQDNILSFAKPMFDLASIAAINYIMPCGLIIGAISLIADLIVGIISAKNNAGGQVRLTELMNGEPHVRWYIKSICGHSGDFLEISTFIFLANQAIDFEFISTAINSIQCEAVALIYYLVGVCVIGCCLKRIFYDYPYYSYLEITRKKDTPLP